MAAARKDLLKKVYNMVPPMLESFHKGTVAPNKPSINRYSNTDNVPGQLGRVGVIGGSEDYTGAPYFSAMASAKLGCDMVRPPLLLFTKAAADISSRTSSASPAPPPSSRPTALT